MKTKVNGFTLLEAMVSILLSSLLVSFTFSIYKNFNQYYFIYSGQTERLNNILHFKRTFNQDWNKALTITGKDKQINLSNNQKSITYQFLDSTIVRYGLIETTFDLIPKDLDLKTDETPAVVERIVTDIDAIVRVVNCPGWQNTIGGEREVQKSLRKALLKYQLHKDQVLFDRAYAYIKEYY